MPFSQLTSADLSDDEKRQILFAILLRHIPEAQPLREKAVDSLVLGALFGTTQETALKLREIQRNLRVGNTTAALRIETIRPSLDRLVKEEKILVSTRRFKKHFYLSPSTQSTLSDAFDSSSEMFRRVVARMTNGIEKSTSEAEHVCRRFMTECFARFGRQIANTVTGAISPDELMAQIDVHGAFRDASKDCQCSRDDLNVLYARCLQFLRSREPEDQKVKLYLARAYYFAALLEFDDRAATNLSRVEFANCIVYLDTNVIIPTLLRRREWLSTFSEVLSIARRLSIEIRVSGTTIQEARNVAARREPDLQKVISKLPELVIENARDTFIEAFVERREEHDTLTVTELLAPFDNIRDILQGEFDVFIDESAEQDFDLTSPDVERIKNVIAETAVELRPYAKSPAAVDHDCTEYLILQREISAGHEAFLLTNDRTLIEAGLRLRPGTRPRHLSFLGFLQSIAPYVTAGEEVSFVEAFSRLILEQLPPIEESFDIRDLRVLADVYDDVQQTPPGQLIEAYHYVKVELARKGPARPLEPNQVVLGLRRFLTSSSDERMRALMSQIESLSTALAANDSIVQELSNQASGAQSDLHAKDRVVQELMTRLSVMEGEVKAQELRDREARISAHRDERRRRKNAFLLTTIVSGVLWTFNHAIVAGLIAQNDIGRRVELPMRVGIDIFGSALFLISAYRLFSFADSPRRKGWLLTACVVGVLFVLRQFDIRGWFSTVEPLVSAVAIIASVLLWVLAGDER